MLSEQVRKQFYQTLSHWPQDGSGEKSPPSELQNPHLQGKPNLIANLDRDGSKDLSEQGKQLAPGAQEQFDF